MAGYNGSEFATLSLFMNFQEGMRENFVKKNKNKTKKQKDRKSVIIAPFSFDQVSKSGPSGRNNLR